MRKILALIAFASLRSFASATVVTTGQLAVPVTIPTSLALGAYESSSQFWVIPELTGIVLPVGFPGGAGLPAIRAGTKIDVYLVHADPTQPTTFAGTATFAEVILGFYPGSAAMNAGDSLVTSFGSSISTYPTGTANRGLEVPGPTCLPGQCFDQYALGNGNHTISLDLHTSNVNMDEARIIVAAAIPEPGSLTLILVPSAIFTATRLRRRNRARR